MSDPEPTGFKLSTRDLLILLLTFFSGTAAGLLLAWSAVPVGQCIIGGFVAAGGTFAVIDRITKH